MIIRFWLISAICVAVALGIFIADFTERRGRLSMRAMTALVYGFAVAGASTARALRAHGVDVVVVDDDPTDARRTMADGPRASNSSPTPTEEPTRSTGRLVRSRLPGTGRARDARGHRCRTAATASISLSEIELAYRWEQDRAGGPRPMLADHRHRRQDDHDAADRRDAARRRGPHDRRRQHGHAARRRDRPRRRCVRGGVHELPVGVDADVPRRGGGVAQPGARSPELAHVDGVATRRRRAGSSPTNAPTTPPSGSATDPVVVRPSRRVAGPTRDVRARPRRLSALDGRWPRRPHRSARDVGRRSAAMRRALPHDITNAWPRRPW